jgi:hypothetical protein
VILSPNPKGKRTFTRLLSALNTSQIQLSKSANMRQFRLLSFGLTIQIQTQLNMKTLILLSTSSQTDTNSRPCL